MTGPLALLLTLSGILTAGFPPEAGVPETVEIPSGSFYMGSAGTGYDYDEAPLHKVTLTRAFRMGVTPVTNVQYEAYDPSHRALRGRDGFSSEDDEAVVQVSYADAVGYCRWLSERTGVLWRLPTEAEWEYACRAGTTTPYYTGETLAPDMERNQQTARPLPPVSLTVGLDTPNAFGLHNMHGLVEEWCLDWYGPYRDLEESDPGGPAKGIFRVTRGGSHNTPAAFLRSANRSAALPADRHAQLGFRVVCTGQSGAIVWPTLHVPDKTASPARISRRKARWRNPSARPVWKAPVPFVIPPVDGSPMYRHNHQPALTWCDNGDLLAVWFTCDAENGREMEVLSSRLRKGKKNWEPATAFFRVPDRNVTGSALLHLDDGRLLHWNGVSTAGDWKDLALVLRESRDGGTTWSAPSLVEPDHAPRHQVIAGPVVTREGEIILCCDAGPGGQDGTSVHISRDGGATWADPWDGIPATFTAGGSGSTVAGIHAGLVQLRDGTLMALGRGNSLPDGTGRERMPVSRSSDGGATWTWSASDFPPIGSGQRLVLKRLQEGPLMLISFTDHPTRTPEAERGMAFGPDGEKGYGMFVALSYDEGRTWPVRKLMTDGKERHLNGGAWTGDFVMDARHAEPKGYLACTQTPDGMIHLVSSRLHYRFNLAWIEAP